MKTKTIEEVISDLKAQCDTKASAVAELLEDMRFNVEAKDFTLLDCADNIADMGEWGQYAAEQLRGKKTKNKVSPSASELAAKGFLNIKKNCALAAEKTKHIANTEKINGLMDVMRGMYDTKPGEYCGVCEKNGSECPGCISALTVGLRRGRELEKKARPPFGGLIEMSRLTPKERKEYREIVRLYGKVSRPRIYRNK